MRSPALAIGALFFGGLTAYLTVNAVETGSIMSSIFAVLAALVGVLLLAEAA